MCGPMPACNDARGYSSIGLERVLMRAAPSSNSFTGKRCGFFRPENARKMRHRLLAALAPEANMAEIVVFVRSRPFFGAQLVMFPALYQLKQWWPHKRLRVVARDDLRKLFESLPWVDEFVHAPTALTELAALDRQCEVFVDLHPSSEWHALAALLKHPPCRIGYRNGRVGDLVWTHALPFDAREYRALHFLHLLQAYRPFDALRAAHGCVESLAAALPAHAGTASGTSRVDGAQGTRPMAALETGPVGGRLPHPRVVTFMPGGGAGEFKKWGMQRFVALADGLAEDAETAFNVILGPAEQEEARMLRDMHRPDFRVVMSPSLSELARIIVASDLVVANDCGPSHLAQCAAVPFVGLFDEDKPEWFWPRRDACCLVPEPGCGLQSLPVPRVVETCRVLLRTATRVSETGQAETFRGAAEGSPVQ